MNKRTTTVLLVGRNEMDFASLRRHLEDQACDCRFVSSYSEGVALFNQLRFDLILCSGQPGIRTLVSAVVGSPASLFCAHAIEDSCLWVPVILHGDECLGKPPLRPREFADTLRRLLDEIRLAPRDRAAAN